MVIFKLALLAIGILIGVFWHEISHSFRALLIAVAVIFSLYIIFVSFKQT
jgi:hypothetical protein